jgi:RHS repeat-associated protein
MLDGEGPLKAAPFYYQLDHLGTPQELTDYSGEIMWSAKYRAYGNLAALDVNEVDNPLRFQGQYFDAETGLHYNRHRYYNPVAGRFLTPDPIKLAGGLNSYQYVPNPTGWVDPLGLNNCPGENTPPANSKGPPLVATVDEGAPPLPKAKDQSGYNSALYERLRASYAADEIKAAQPVGSALKEDPMHRAPSYVVDQIPDKGRVFSLRGGGWY